MANLGKTLLVAGAMAVSGIAGYMIGDNNSADKEYQINRNDSTVVLYNKNLDKEHEIFKIENDFYVGNSEHQLKGLKNVTIYEVMNEMDLKEPAYKVKKDTLQK